MGTLLDGGPVPQYERKTRNFLTRNAPVHYLTFPFSWW